MREGTSVVVVGAGITGLALGFHLTRLGVPHLILEGANRAGGVIRSGRVRGHLLEWGPQRTRLTAAVREIVEALDLSNELVTPPPGLPLYVYRDAALREVPFSAAGFLRSDIVDLAAKLRLLLEPLSAGARDEESVADFFTRKLGRSVYENLAGPLYGGLYASDPADMVVGLSLRHVLKEFGVGRSLLLTWLRRRGGAVPPAACSFQAGMRALADALLERGSEAVRLSAPVEAIQRSGDGWRVEFDGGSIQTRHVVFTTPARVTGRLLQGVATDAAVRIGSLVYNPLAVVHLHSGADLVGLGYQVSLAERLATRGVTFNHSLFERTGIYTAYLGGARAPEVVSWADEVIGAVAVREFSLVTGFDAEPLAIAREAMPAWDRSWAALEGVRLPVGLHLAANWESRPGIPGRLAQAKRLAHGLAADLARYGEARGSPHPAPVDGANA